MPGQKLAGIRGVVFGGVGVFGMLGPASMAPPVAIAAAAFGAANAANDMYQNHRINKCNDDRIIESFHREVQESFEVIELDEPLMAQAALIARRYALRGADAIQMAALLLARDHSTHDLILLSADNELNAAAAAEGAHVENPDAGT